MRKAPFEIPNICGSLAEDVTKGEITMEQAAEELHKANVIPHIDAELAAKRLAPYMEKPQIITKENWPERWEDVPAGTEVSGEVYDQMLNVLPPISLRKSPYCGFQAGGLHSYREDEDGKMRPRFLTFVNVGGKFYYAGICFGGECDWRMGE